MIDRRDALAGMAAMFGTALFAPIGRAAAAEIPSTGGRVPDASPFTAEQRLLVTALSERVMPTTDTPGAIAAGVPAFIEQMLAEWGLPDERAPILAGLDAIEVRSRADYRVPAHAATDAQQDALLTLAMAGQLPGGSEFFEYFRQLVLTGYFTSEIGITQEREYLPVPGRYDGAFPYTPGSKVFSS
jgi:hypothetical protein